MKKLPYILFLLVVVSVLGCLKNPGYSLREKAIKLDLSPIAVDDTVLNRYIEDIEKNEVITRQVDTITRPYEAVEQMPSFPGGDAEMFRFVSNNMRIPKIPDSLITENLTTVVRFVIAKTGEIKDIEPLERYKGTILSDTLVNIVKRMPRWNPGRQNGQPVDVYFSIPLRIHPNRE